ncbi:MAG TPA: hypothetical protein VKX25_15695 [Bryobacteraceae bacterium]|nr:hypothetical protein [Bryobacteraceae bacterium]
MPRFFATLTLFALSLPGLAGPVSGSYYSQAAFQQAIAALGRPVQVAMDDFSSAQVTLPGVSVSSDINFDGYSLGSGNGHFAAGAYTDSTGKYTETVWHFTQPTYAFAGLWNLGNVNAGLEVDAGGHQYFLPDGLVAANSLYSPQNQWSGFWGFVLTVPVDTVIIRSGDESLFNGGQSYQLSNLEVGAIMPEPGSVALGLVGLMLIGVGAARRSKKRGPRTSG